MLRQAAVDLQARLLLARLLRALRAWLALARRRRQLQRLHKRLLATLRLLRLQQALRRWQAAAARLTSLRALQQRVAARHVQRVLGQVLAAWQRRVAYSEQLAKAAEQLVAVAQRLRLELRLAFAHWRAWARAAREQACCRLRHLVQLRACCATWMLYWQYRQRKQAAVQAVLVRAGAARLRHCLEAWSKEAHSSKQSRVQNSAAVKHWRLSLLRCALQRWIMYAADHAAKAQAKELARAFR